MQCAIHRMRRPSGALAALIVMLIMSCSASESTVSSASEADNCTQYGFATMAAWEDFTRACSRDPRLGGRTATVAVWFNCRRPSQHVDTQELRWTRCLTDVVHPSGGLAVETWSSGCTQVDGVCVIRDLADVDLGDLDLGSPEGALMRATYDRMLAVRNQVIAEAGDNLASRLMLLDAAELISDSALEAFRERAIEEGSSLLSKSLALIDIATDFVPGVSAIKDATIVLTGINPITGETVTDAERAMVAGTLLVPSFVSGAARGLVRAVSRLDHIATTGIRSARHADEVARAIRRADDELRILVDCVTFSVTGQIAAAANCNAAGGVVAEVAQHASDTLDWIRKGNTGFGTAPRLDYAKTFRQHYAHLNSEIGQVHHAVEQTALTRYPGVVTEAELHSLENLRGIPVGPEGTNLHQSLLRREWDVFYESFESVGKTPTKKDLLDYAKLVDGKYGARFVPPVRL